MGAALLEVESLQVDFKARDRSYARVVDDVSFSIEAGQTVALVGESGSGKSVTALAVMGLHDPRSTRIRGRIGFADLDLTTLSDNRLARLRGAEIAMIFQDPMTSLNPVVTVGRQVSEVLVAHRKAKGKAAGRRAVELLDMVGIPDPDRRAGEYPHQMSGGMRQRALIAIALACEPRLLIADEPTTALDVTIQAQILALLKALVTDTGTSLLMITHDLGVVAGLCDTVNVMYGGRIVESAERREFFRSPRHPYTHGLLGSVPQFSAPRTERLNPIPGNPSDRVDWARGCAFAPRCASVTDTCLTSAPELVPSPGAHLLRCFNPMTPDGAAAPAQEVVSR
jgi:peptide/nickel transport system ATP-binding protein